MDFAQLIAALNGATPEQKDQLRKALDTGAAAGSQQSAGLTRADLDKALEPFRKSHTATPVPDFGGASTAANLVDGTGYLEELTKSMKAGVSQTATAIDRVAAGQVLLVQKLDVLSKALDSYEDKLTKALSAPLPSHVVTTSGAGTSGAGAGNSQAALENISAGQLLDKLMKAHSECPESDLGRRSTIEKAIVDYETGAMPTVEALAGMGITL